MGVGAGPTAAPREPLPYGRSAGGPGWSSRCLQLQLPDVRRERAEEVDDPRPPTRRDVIVDADHLTGFDGCDRAPPWPGRDGADVLVTALRVRQHDEVRAGSDDVLGGQLRVVGCRRSGTIRDVF